MGNRYREALARAGDDVPVEPVRFAVRSRRDRGPRLRQTCGAHGRSPGAGRCPRPCRGPRRPPQRAPRLPLRACLRPRRAGSPPPGPSAGCWSRARVRPRAPPPHRARRDFGSRLEASGREGSGSRSPGPASAHPWAAAPTPPAPARAGRSSGRSRPPRRERGTPLSECRRSACQGGGDPYCEKAEGGGEQEAERLGFGPQRVPHRAAES